MIMKNKIHTDLKDIVKLSIIFIILIITAWAVSFYSTVDSTHKKLLFSSYELNQWDAIESNQVLYVKKNSKLAKDISTLVFEVNPKRWDRILNDLSQIYVVEKVLNPSTPIKQKFSNLWCFIVYKNFIQSSVCIGDANLSTGNFLIKIQDSYFIAKTDMYFEGLYQSEVEGNLLSYQRLLSYFKEPFKRWYGENFWTNATQWSLKTKKNTLFTISADNHLLLPSVPSEVQVDQVMLSRYLENFRKWVPANTEKVSTTQQAEYRTAYDFLIAVKAENGKMQNFALLSDGLWWLEKNIFFAAPQATLDQLVVLPDSFYQKKILSMEALWKEMQKGEIDSIQWQDLRKDKNIVLQSKVVVSNPKWQQFFCLLSGCLPPDISVVMKIKTLTDAEFEQQLTVMDHQLQMNKHKYYFKHDPYRLEVLTPQKFHFIFVSRLKELYP